MAVTFMDCDKLEKFIEICVEETLICPPPYDFSSDEYDGVGCTSNDCKLCWLNYMEPDSNVRDSLIKLMKDGEKYQQL